MNNKIVAVLGAAVISLGTIGGVAFASTMNNSSVSDNQQITIQESKFNKNDVDKQSSDTKINNTVKADITEKSIGNNDDNSSKDIYKDMVKIMRDNGYKDAARYMQTGNYDAMTNYMNDISQEDYDKMIEIMNDNGYEYMGQMMESIGREGMIQMHNSMGSMNGRGNNGMMGEF